MAPLTDEWIDVDGDDEWADAAPSVADIARARLAARGLTPEAIKANPALLISSPNDFTYTPKTTDRGFGGEFLGAVNPVEIAKNIGSGLAHDFGTVQFGLDAYAPIEPKINPVPDFVGIAKEAYRRGQAGESLDGMYGNLAGAAALTAAGTGVGSAVRGAPKLVANAEAAYADALATPATRPLTESLAGKMMDRVGVVRNAAKLSDSAAAGLERATAAKEAAMQANPAPNVWRSNPARRQGAARVRAAADDVKFYEDVQVIADALEDQSGGGNILTGAAKRVAVKAAKIVGGRAAGVATKKLLDSVPTTTAWKTATAVAKKRFGEAMSRGDEALAAEIGAGIASGALAADDFGHRAAIQSLAQELEPLGSAELKRQAVSSKRGFYRDPDGREIEVPRNVMAAMVDSADVNEISSPVALWLGAMQKQGKVKGGGTFNFGATPSQAGQLNRVRNERINEWPANVNAPDENDAMLVQRTDPRTGAPLKFPRPIPPSVLLPQHFKNARQVAWGAPLDKRVDEGYGHFGTQFDPRDKPVPDPNAPGFRRAHNTILIDPEANDSPAIWTHELGHAIYDRDLTSQQREKFKAATDSITERLKAEIVASGVTPNTPGAREKLLAIINKYPRAVTAYANEPDAFNRYHETFAEMWAQYMANPTPFKRTYPQEYELLRQFAGGHEYIGGRAPR